MCMFGARRVYNLQVRQILLVLVGSEELSGEDSSPDYVRLGEGCLLCLKACECLNMKPENGESEYRLLSVLFPFSFLF